MAELAKIDELSIVMLELLGDGTIISPEEDADELYSLEIFFIEDVLRVCFIRDGQTVKDYLYIIDNSYIKQLDDLAEPLIEIGDEVGKEAPIRFRVIEKS